MITITLRDRNPVRVYARNILRLPHDIFVYRCDTPTIAYDALRSGPPNFELIATWIRGDSRDSNDDGWRITLPGYPPDLYSDIEFTIDNITPNGGTQ